MQIKKNLNSLDKLYIIFFSFVLFINIFIPTSLRASIFEITDVEIIEPFKLNFNKEKVIDKGFKKAFIRLMAVITTTDDKSKIKMGLKFENIINIPDDIKIKISNGEKGLVLLKIITIIGEKDVEKLDIKSIGQIVQIMNEFKMIELRNQILLKVLPLKV